MIAARDNSIKNKFRPIETPVSSTLGYRRLAQNQAKCGKTDKVISPADRYVR
jgi:hypothetical protein